MITASSGRIKLVEGRTGSGVGGLSAASLSFTLSNAEDADSGEFSCVASADIPVTGSLADTVNFNITVLGERNYINYVLAFLCACARVTEQRVYNILKFSGIS